MNRREFGATVVGIAVASTMNVPLRDGACGGFVVPKHLASALGDVGELIGEPITIRAPGVDEPINGRVVAVNHDGDDITVEWETVAPRTTKRMIEYA